jgi:hypothetical protein
VILLSCFNELYLATAKTLFCMLEGMSGRWIGVLEFMKGLRII